MELEVLEEGGPHCIFLQVRVFELISPFLSLTKDALRLILEYVRLMSEDRTAMSYTSNI